MSRLLCCIFRRPQGRLHEKAACDRTPNRRRRRRPRRARVRELRLSRADEQLRRHPDLPERRDGHFGRQVPRQRRSQRRRRIQIFSTEAYALRFKIEFQFFTNQVRVYYTTDGSTPAGSFGTATSLTTQVATASYVAFYSDQTQACQIVDIAAASIPPQPAGTTVKYIIGVWHSGGGPEVFANSGTCTGCFTCTISTCATVFDYSVVSPTAVTFRSASADRTPAGVLLRWRTGSEAGTLGFNVYRQVRAKRVKLNRHLIPARRAFAGAAYSYLDRRAPRGASLRYWLRVVALDGSGTWRGPFRVTASSAS